MKTFLVIISAICLIGCFTKDFEIIEASSQKWIGGAPGSGKGTNYNIKVLPFKDSDKLQIDKIWIGNEYFEINALVDPKDTKNKSFEKNDTLYIKVHKYIRTGRHGEVAKNDENKENIVPEEY